MASAEIGSYSEIGIQVLEAYSKNSLARKIVVTTGFQNLKVKSGLAKVLLIFKFSPSLPFCLPFPPFLNYSGGEFQENCPSLNTPLSILLL